MIIIIITITIIIIIIISIIIISLLTLSIQVFLLSVLETGHYLSPGGKGAEDFRGDHLIFRRTKGGISRNWEPKIKGESLKTLEGFRRGTLKFAWKVKTWVVVVVVVVGGDRESHQKLLGGIG